MSYLAGLDSSDVQLIFKDEILSENGQLIDADPFKYNAGNRSNTQDGVTYVTSYVSIFNALKADVGNYTCHRSSQKSSIFVQVDEYLPPLDFPKCNIEPELTVVNGTDVTFTCEPGDSNPPVKLNLTLHRPDGSVLLLGVAPTTRQVTTEDNGSVFVCQMKSDTFYRASERNCSAGPVRITCGKLCTNIKHKDHLQLYQCTDCPYHRCHHSYNW